MSKRLNTKGFSAVEALLILVIVFILGFTGWFVWHSKQATDKTLTAANKSAQSTTPKTTKKSSTMTNNSSQKYFTITEWKVRAPYSGTLTLSYTFEGADKVHVTSAQLKTADSNCATYGGQIWRVAKNGPDPSDSSRTGADRAALMDNSNTTKQYALIGDNYYFFVHDQAACSSNATTIQLEDQTNAAVKALVTNLVTE